MKLSDCLGKPITDFCKNNFTDPDENHCAHFVCHALEIAAGYTCKLHKGGRNLGACLRVHELFSICPEVGNWSNAPQGVSLAFITDKNNVNLASAAMRNVPKKHVGIFIDGFIYNYSNKQDIVVRQTPAEFLSRFQKTYGGNQAIFFGTLPPSAKIPDSEDGLKPHAPLTPSHIKPAAIGSNPVIRVDGKDFFATLGGGDEYYLGRETKYGAHRGLYQPGGTLYGPTYSIPDYMDAYGAVAGILGVIAASESSGFFNRLNSYDRAAFTFGFFQLAAHTPADNLILLFRRLASEHTEFQSLFPELKVINGKLHRLVGAHSISLENKYPRPGSASEENLKDFMTYLNADGSKIDETELSTASRLVKLANSDAGFNDLQVNVAAQILMRKMRNTYNAWYNLNGVSDLICAAISDIHHQGRGSKSQVRAALDGSSTTNGKLNLLCKIGEEKYESRCTTLKNALAQTEENGYLGSSVFDSASGLFRPNDGWPD